MEQRSISHKVEAITAWTLAGISIGLGVLDLLGLLEGFGLREKLTSVLLLLLGSLLLAASQLLTAQHRAEAQAASVEAFLRRDLIARLPDIVRTLDPGFRIVAEPVVRERVHQLTTMLVSRTFCINGVDDFRPFYVKVIRALEPGTTLLATSLPSSDFFWRGTALDQAIQEFIGRGGRLQRVFFVPAAVEGDAQVAAVLDRHATMGVEVFACDPACVGGGERLILCDLAGRFGWEVNVGRDGAIRWADVTADPEDIRDFHGYFTMLDACPSLTPHGGHGRAFCSPNAVR